MSAELNRESARLWVEAYLEDLTAHGLCRITATAAYLPGIVRLLWGVVFTAAFAFALQQCSVLLAQFQRNEVDVSVDFSFNKEVNFPAVTLCNLNSLRRSEVLKTRLHEFVNTTAPPTATTKSAASTTPGQAPTSQRDDVTVVTTTDSRHLEFQSTARSTIVTTAAGASTSQATTMFHEPGEETFPVSTTAGLEPSLKPQITTQPNFILTTKMVEARTTGVTARAATTTSTATSPGKAVKS